MTRKELIKEVTDAWRTTFSPSTRLFKCNAHYRTVLTNDKICTALMSYNTIVAVYDGKTVYGFDYYSATTVQHIHKFAHLYGAPIVWLYNNSATRAQQARENMAHDFENVITW